MSDKANNTEYYTYPSKFYYNRYALRENAQYFSSPNNKIENVIWVNTSVEQQFNNTFIKKVLSAVEIESSSDYVLHSSENAPAWLEVKKNFPNLHFMLVFGFRPRDLGLQTHNDYNRWVYLNDCHLLCTQSLEELEPSAQLKMQLWNELKKLDRS